MKPRKISGGSLLIAIAVFGIAIIAFLVRTVFPYEKIFANEWVKFNGSDSYFHMRLVDSLVANFPRLTGFDPYHLFPAGITYRGFYFFDWLLAAIIKVAGLGSPSPRLIDTISVYYPAVLGAITVIPTYFLGKALFNRWAGVVAAVLVALLPGELLNRSILGFTDHHVAEVLLSTTAMLFLVMAIKSARRINLDIVLPAGWQKFLRPALYSLVGGLFMGLYFVTWIGAQLFVFIVFLFLVIQLIANHLQRRENGYLGVIGIAFFSGLLVIYLGLSRENLAFHIMPLLIALFAPPLLALASQLMVKRQMRPVYFPFGVFGLGSAMFVVLRISFPGITSQLQQAFSIFLPGETSSGLTTLEMMPFFKPVAGDSFFLTPAWLNLYTALPLSIIAFFILAGIMLAKKQFVPEKVLFLIWSLVMFLLTVMQRRFDYYFTINAALLVGYISVIIYLLTLFFTRFHKIISLILNLAVVILIAVLILLNYSDSTKYETALIYGYFTIIFYLAILFINVYSNRKKVINYWQQLLGSAGLEISPGSGQPKMSRDIKKKRGNSVFSGKNYLGHILAIPLILSLVVSPGLGTSLDIAKAAAFVPSDSWLSALTWLKDNSPEPFADPEAYNRYYPPLPPGASFDYPLTAYGVMSWWDYGYFITRVAHRIPIANPGQDPEPIRRVAGVFLSQNETGAREVVEASEVSYIIVDNAMATTKFWAIAQWNGQDRTDYFDTYYVRQGNQLIPRTFYYPEYYRSLVVRLYTFDGKAVTPNQIKLIAYEDKFTGDGFVFRMVSDSQSFSNYQQAVAYINSHPGYRIVGDDPFLSAVPLEALGDYRLVYSSEQTAQNTGAINMPEVKIFEVVAN